MYNNFNNNEEPQETVRQTLERVMREKEMEMAKNQALEYASKVKLSDNNNLANYSFGAGIIKEGADFLNKVPLNNEFWRQSNKLEKISSTLKDSWKDIKNNYEAVKSGLQNPKSDGRLWLKDFDYKTNTWKK